MGDEINKIVAGAEKYKEEDERMKKKVTAKNDLENMAYQIRNSLDDPKLSDKIEDAEKTKIREKIDETVKWVDENQAAEVDEFEEKKKELEEMWRPIKVQGPLLVRELDQQDQELGMALRLTRWIR